MAGVTVILFCGVISSEPGSFLIVEIVDEYICLVLRERFFSRQ